jgi:hypothetical protein
MATGSIEQLPSGSFRAVVRAGKDPITGKRIKITETCTTEAARRVGASLSVVHAEIARLVAAGMVADRRSDRRG